MTISSQANPETTDARASARPVTSRRRARTVVLCLAILLAGLAVGLVVGRMTTPEADVPGIASASTSAMLADLVTALNRGDATEIASFYAPDAIFMQYDQEPAGLIETAGDIGSQLSGYRAMGAEVTSAGTAVSYGSFVALPVQTGGGRGGIEVFEFDKAGLITRQWYLAAVHTPTWR